VDRSSRCVDNVHTLFPKLLDNLVVGGGVGDYA
jgi:hypothetical protein